MTKRKRLVAEATLPVEVDEESLNGNRRTHEICILVDGERNNSPMNSSNEIDENGRGNRNSITKTNLCKNGSVNDSADDCMSVRENSNGDPNENDTGNFRQEHALRDEKLLELASKHVCSIDHHVLLNFVKDVFRAKERSVEEMSHDELMKFASELILTLSHPELERAVQGINAATNEFCDDGQQQKQCHNHEDSTINQQEKISNPVSASARTSIKFSDSTKWVLYFMKLADAKQKHGDFNTTDPALCKWQVDQCRLCLSNQLSEERLCFLAQIGFLPQSKSKVSNKVSDGWVSNFLKLAKYKKEHADFNSTDPSLCKWQAEQCKLHRSNQLSEDCLAFFAHIGYFDNVPDAVKQLMQSSNNENGDSSENKSKAVSDPKKSDKALSYTWLQYFTKLVQHKNKYGDFNATDPLLSEWMAKQRQLHSTNELSDKSLYLLNTIGFFSQAPQATHTNQPSQTAQPSHAVHAPCSTPRASSQHPLLLHQIHPAAPSLSTYSRPVAPLVPGVSGVHWAPGAPISTKAPIAPSPPNQPIDPIATSPSNQPIAPGPLDPRPSCPMGKIDSSGQHTGQLTKEEHEAFLEAFHSCGKIWDTMAARVKTRTGEQIKTHAQKYFQMLQKDLEGGVVSRVGDADQPNAPVAPVAPVPPVATVASVLPPYLIPPPSIGEVVESGQKNTGQWTREEHAAFIAGVQLYGKKWKKVAALVKTRTVMQTRTHAQKYFQKDCIVVGVVGGGGVGGVTPIAHGAPGAPGAPRADGTPIVLMPPKHPIATIPPNQPGAPVASAVQPLATVAPVPQIPRLSHPIEKAVTSGHEQKDLEDRALESGVADFKVDGGVHF